MTFIPFIDNTRKNVAAKAQDNTTGVVSLSVIERSYYQHAVILAFFEPAAARALAQQLLEAARVADIHAYNRATEAEQSFVTDNEPPF